MTILSSPLTPNQEWGRSMRGKHQVIEEPDEKKFSRPVLKESSGKRFPVRLYLTAKAKKGKRKAQKPGLNRSILDVGFGIIGQMLDYKLVEAGGF